MIPEYHLYHGAMLASLVSGAGQQLSIYSPPGDPRPAEYIVNGAVGLHVKHATQRLRPWHFSFTPENIKAIRSLRDRFRASFLVLVCRQDGTVAVDLETVINNIPSSDLLWIRADREKRKHYRLHGPMGEFPRKYDSHMLAVKEALRISPSQ